jgi:hypothetical protein
MVPWLPPVLEQLFAVANDPEAPMDVKPLVLTCFSDVAMAVGGDSFTLCVESVFVSAISPRTCAVGTRGRPHMCARGDMM